MDKAALVDFDVKVGAEILEILDRAKLRMSVALWAYLSDYEDWRLVLAGRPFNNRGLKDGYALVHDTLSAGGIRPSQTPILMIFPMTDPFIVALRRFFGKTASVDGMRLGGHVIGDRYLADAYVYRIK
jgi:hypothetical protein